MPSARDNKAPYFSGQVGDPLDEFLREYEELATTCTLNNHVMYASKFLLIYLRLLHSRSCDRPRSIFASISFSLRRLVF